MASPLPSPLAVSPQPLAPTELSPRRFKIFFEDDAVRQRSEQAVQLLFTNAASNDATSTSALLAKKALKYRKVLERLEGVDMTSPEFDASKFLGVDWCKTSSLKDLCATHPTSNRDNAIGSYEELLAS